MADTQSVRREPAPEPITRIMLRPVASGLPLGFLAFGTGTILLTTLELQWVPLARDSALMVMVLAFVAPLELLAGIFAFLARDSGTATALSTLGAAWIATALTVLPLGRRGRARTSIEGDLGHQIEQAESEPGIRRQL